MKNLIFLILVLTVCFGSSALAEQAWQLKDLEAAASRSDYQSLAQHLLDIPARDRGDAWYNLLKATVLYQMEVLKPTDKFLVNLDTLALLRTAPSAILDQQTILNVARFLRINSTPQAEATSWYLLALTKATDTKEVCADPDLKLATMNGLYLSEQRKDLVDDSKKILDLCWAELQAGIVSELSADNTYFLKNVCPALAAHQLKLGTLAQELCQNSKD